MRCEDAAPLIHAGESSPDLEVHLSACDDCRMLSEDLAELGAAFARARETWVPPENFRVHLPLAPWKKMAIAACMLVVPLATWAGLSTRAPRPNYDLGSIVDPAPPSPPSDRETLARLLMEDYPR